MMCFKADRHCMCEYMCLFDLCILNCCAITDECIFKLTYHLTSAHCFLREIINSQKRISSVLKDFHSFPKEMSRAQKGISSVSKDIHCFPNELYCSQKGISHLQNPIIVAAPADLTLDHCACKTISSLH